MAFLWILKLGDQIEKLYSSWLRMNVGYIEKYLMCGFRLAAAQEAAQAGAAPRAAGDAMGGPHAPAASGGPSSLFLLSDENPIRRYTKHNYLFFSSRLSSSLTPRQYNAQQMTCNLQSSI